MNRRAYAFAGSLAVAFVAATQAWSQGFVDPRTKFTDPGCTDMKLVSTGAPFPRDPSTLAVRWTGFSNWELAYKNEVLLLDVYIDRGATFMPLGYKAADVTRANAILIGHGHSDHMSDAASISTRLKIPVYGAPVTAEKLREQQVPESQIKPVSGKDPKTETTQIGLFKVEPVLGRHGEPPANITAAVPCRRRCALGFAWAPPARDPVTSAKLGPTSRHEDVPPVALLVVALARSIRLVCRMRDTVTVCGRRLWHGCAAHEFVHALTDFKDLLDRMVMPDTGIVGSKKSQPGIRPTRRVHGAGRARRDDIVPLAAGLDPDIALGVACQDAPAWR